MSRTYDVPFTVNGRVVGRAVLNEDDDGLLQGVASLFIDTERADGTLLDLIRTGTVQDISLNAPPVVPSVGRVGGEESAQ